MLDRPFTQVRRVRVRCSDVDVHERPKTVYEIADVNSVKNRPNPDRIIDVYEKMPLEYTPLDVPRPAVPAAMVPVLECMRVVHAAKCAEISQKNECARKIRQALDILAVGSPELRRAVEDVRIKEFPVPRIPSDTELIDVFVDACRSSCLYTAAVPLDPVGVAPEDAPEVAPYPTSSVIGMDCSMRLSTASSVYPRDVERLFGDTESQGSNCSRPSATRTIHPTEYVTM